MLLFDNSKLTIFNLAGRSREKLILQYFLFIIMANIYRDFWWQIKEQNMR